MTKPVSGTPPDDELIVVEEPYGHADERSKIERAWEAAPAGCAMSRTRTERFDARSSLLYSPVVYEHRKLVVEDDEFDDDWIRNAFLSFVRAEFGKGAARLPPDAIVPEIVGRSSIGPQVLSAYVDACEALIYADPVRALQHESSGDMVEDVFKVITHPLLGHKDNQQNLDWEEFRQTVEAQVERKERLLFVVPACPFKDQNPLRTLSGPAFPDAGDVAFLASLHTLALALYQVHPFGADWVVLADGELYAELFGVEREEARAYRERLRAFRNELNMQGTVSILDLREVIDSFRGAVGGERFDNGLERVRGALREWVDATDAVGDAFRVLVDGMRWNLASRDLLDPYPPETIWDLLTAESSDSLDAALGGCWEELHQRAVCAAIEYAAVNLMLRRFDLLNATFPGSMRATVHPKSGQLAIRAHGSAYPWNAVAFRREGADPHNAIESHPAYALAREGRLNGVYLEGYSVETPIYFERA